MKKRCFLWLPHRITEKLKAEKARNTKKKRLRNSRSTASKQLVALRSSPRDNHPQGFFSRDAKANLSNISPQTKHTLVCPACGFCFKTASPPLRTKRNGGDAVYNLFYSAISALSRSKIASSAFQKYAFSPRSTVTPVRSK